MSYNEISRDYINLIKSNPEAYIEDYRKIQDQVGNSTAIYKGQPVPFLYNPMFFSKEDMENFSDIGEAIIRIGNIVMGEYINNPEFRKKFKYSKDLEELILTDSGYDINYPIGRFDIFYKDKDNFKFCELNTDGSSAMNEDNTLARILLESKACKDFSDFYELEYFELIDSWVEKSLEIYKTWNGKDKIDKPNIAILDFMESATSVEFQLFKESFERSGYRAIIADPVDLEFRDGKLYRGDYRIDMVYRRIVTFEAIERLDEIKDFIAAYKAGAFCSIGSFKSQLIHNKIIFKILHDEDSLNLLTKEDQDFVKNHIPYTREFIGGDEVFNHVVENKDKYIMKPLDLNASRGVYVGRDLSQEEWESRLRDSFNSDYIYQEFVLPYRREFVVIEDDKIEVEDFGSIIGLFMYKERLEGLYTRIGKENIISGLSSYYTLPNVLAKKS